MIRPTHVRQPGQALEPRVVGVTARGCWISIELRTGEHLLTALADGLHAAGFASGVAHLAGLAFSPFAYVMPALSKTSDHAAFYSDTFRPAGITRIDAGAVTIGTRDGAPFFHAHATWHEADGRRSGGHILPEPTTLAADTTCNVLALDGAAFDARHDPETNFKLFAPVATTARGVAASERILALRLKPNEDLIETLLAEAARHSITRARIVGGVGSLIGAAFGDGTEVRNFATEVFITSGRIIAHDTDGLAADVRIGLVDHTGACAAGQLVRGRNPVLMTFELVLIVEETAHA